MAQENKKSNREESQEKREPSGRHRRIPLGTLRKKMTLEGIEIPPNKVAHWFVGEARAQMALAAGYTYVINPAAKVGEGPENQREHMNAKISRVVDREKGTRAYLMWIDKEWYDEDQREKQKEVDEIDKAIHRGEIGSQSGDGRYVPKDGIRYTP